MAIYNPRYIVKSNSCDCHPETCCCDDYQIFDTVKQEKYIPINSKSIANDLVSKLNQLDRLERLASPSL